MVLWKTFAYCIYYLGVVKFHGRLILDPLGFEVSDFRILDSGFSVSYM